MNTQLNPFIGHAEREYVKWLVENPIETWEDDYTGAAISIRFEIDEEILTNIYTESKNENRN